MKKTLFFIFAALIVFAVFAPPAHASQCPGYADSIVPCGQLPSCRCEIADFFTMLLNIYKFIVWQITPALAGLLIVAGGGLILISGFDPKYYDRGKTILWSVFFGVAFIALSWLIVDILLKIFGYNPPGGWSSPF